ncbi:hypothetical protein COF37_21405 [Bacillus wiedmannii]|nr:hypothetical protein COF37_21405 [Bacillus wiedmannii]
MSKIQIPIDLPHTDIRCQRELKYLMYIHLFGDITIDELCKTADLHKKQLYRAWHGSSTYRSQQATAIALIANLPYEVSDELIDLACKIVDIIAKANLDIFRLDGEIYD